ncbi:MAG: ribonuclease catalytic domain-containing protein, partial [Myxococcota bacterium]
MHEGLPGTVVLLAERGELGPAWVAAREGSRFVLQSLIGERFAVAPQRLFWVGRQVLGNPDELAAYWQEVQRLAAVADLATAWRDAPDAAPATVAAHALGNAGPAAEDAVALAVFRDPTCYKMKERTLVRESDEAVGETRRKRAEKEAAAEKLANARAAIERALAGEPLTLDDDYRAALVDVAAHGREGTGFALAEPLLTALKVPLALPALPTFELLVRLGVFTPDSNLAPIRAGMTLSFAPEVLAEAERVAQQPLPIGKDLSHLMALAIDDPETTEIDDAVALDPSDPERLHVLIADAAAWVTPGSLLDKAAQARVSTLYLPEGKVPMLPPVIAEGVASLIAGAERSALDFSFRIEADGRLRDLDITRVRIRVQRAFTYDEADRLLTGGEAEAGAADLAGPEAAALRRVAELVERHRAARHRRGAVTFQRPEVYFVREPDGTIRPKVGDPLGPARQLISELLVATCAAAAEYCVDRGIPCLYRTQAAPDEPVPATDPRTGRIDDPARQYELLRRLKPSQLKTTADAHFTLGVGAYTQLTSPIRRYADLLMHQQIAAVLRTGRPC